MSDPHLSSVRRWPYRPDFNQFKRQAKELLKAYRAGDASAVAEVERYEQAPDPAAFALHDAQRVLARSYGFASWQKLKSYVQTIQPYWRLAEIKSDDDTNKFLRLACITYFDADHPSRRDRARQIFAEKPHLAKANLYTAAAVGDVAAVTDFLTRGADVHAKGGPFNWEPLLYAAYSRLDSETAGHSTLEVARLLLAAGADPNAGFLWEGGYVLTALTGVLGLGEDDCGRGDGPLWQPPHEHWREFARLLLDAGADPNDNQGIYNRMQQPDDGHLKLLLEYGLGTDRGGPWFKRFWQDWPYAPITRSPADLVAWQLRWAVGANYFDRVKLLVENGVDVNRPSGGRTSYAEAVYSGHHQIADYLAAKGAKRIAINLSQEEEFHIACYRDDADRVRQLVASDPSLLDDAEALLAQFAESGCVKVVRLLVERGASVNGTAGRESPLWCAARGGQLDTVKLLVELGADVHARNPAYNSKPLGAANYKDQREVVEYLMQFAPIWDAVKFGGLDRVRTLLRENPRSVNARDDEGRTSLHCPYWNTRHGEEMIELLIAHGADINARDNAGRNPIDQMLQNGRRDLAEVLRRHGGDSA
jgi:ankyrin repeat protein